MPTSPTTPWYMQQGTQGPPGTPNAGTQYSLPNPNAAPSNTAAQGAGYAWDPVKKQYTRDPQAAGERMRAALSGLFAGDQNIPLGPSFSSSSYNMSGAGAVPQLNMPGMFTGSASATNPALAHLQPPDTSAAEAAVFARAKDKIGQETQGAITGLRSSLGARGMLGSGAEAKETQKTIGQGQQELGNVTREQAITGADLAQKNAELAYSGGITQRGQDISAGESAADRALRAWQANTSAGLSAYDEQLKAYQLQREAALRQQSVQQQSLSGLMGAFGSVI